MTPSAARGLLEAVLWKPAIRWRIERIHVLREIRFIAFRRNEVSSRAVAPSASLVRAGGTVSHYFADDDRAQRNTLALRNVDYLIEAHFELTSRAGPEENATKFGEIFQRRLAKGQQFHQPYFGCRELAAEVLPADDSPPPIEDSRDLGLMLWDIDYSPGQRRPLFFAARLDSGILHVPAEPEVGLSAGGEG
jgi:CRISPR-associated protein Cas5d